MRMENEITVAEAAAVLRVSDETVQRACRTGALGHRRVGRAIRIPREAFEAYREGLKHRPFRVEAVQTFDAELSTLVEAWLRLMEVGARQCAPDTVRTHRKHMHKYVRLLLGPDPSATLSWREAVTERALGRAIASLPATQFATRYNLYMAVMSWTRFLVENGLLDEGERAAMKRHKPRRLLPPRRTVLHSRTRWPGSWRRSGRLRGPACTRRRSTPRWWARWSTPACA